MVGEAREPLDENARSGDVAGKYQLFASLGRGGMAEVFLALAHGPMGFNKLVVVKRLRGSTDDPSFVTMFLDEAKLAARLNHANVVHTYEVGEHSGEYFIAMEYLEGQPLSRLLARAKELGKPLPEPIALKIVTDALAGLQYAHEARDYDGTPLNVVHRDVSPQNVFVTYEGEVKIVDFGIAKAALNSVHTDEGLLKGKVHYMSPEQAMGQPLDRRSDVYAAGGVLWEVLAGERAVAGDMAAALSSLLQGTTRDLRSVAPHVSVALDAIVKRAMEPTVEARYATAAAFRSDLAAYAAGGPGLASSQVLAAFMMEHFEADRSDIQRRIREHLTQHGTASSSSSSRILHLGPDASGPVPSARTGMSHVSLVSSPPPAPTRSRAVTKYAVAAAVLALAGFAYFARRLPPNASTSPDTHSAASVATSTPEAIDVSIETTPPSAKLSVDGVDVPNPYRVHAPKDAALHDVRAMAEGYLASKRVMAFDRNVSLEIALERDGAAASTLSAATVPAPPPAAHRAPANPPAASSAPKPPPPGPSTPR